MRRRASALAIPTGNPYAADLFASVALDLGTASGLQRVRAASDAARRHPEVRAAVEAARGRAEREAVTGSVAALVRRTACP